MAGAVFKVDVNVLTLSPKTWGVRKVGDNVYAVNYNRVLKNGEGLNWAEAIMAATPKFRFKPFVDIMDNTE
jgi:hypothetical protein